MNMVTLSRNTIRNDAFGNRVKTTVPGCSVTTCTYDTMNRLSTEVVKNASGTTMAGFTYTYTNLGQKASATEQHGANAITTTWQYDERGRLTEEMLTYYSSTSNRTQTWKYDFVGNRTQQISGPRTTTYVYDDNDRLTSETTGSATTTYGYTITH